MKFFDKIKDLFTDEVPVSEVPVKKEVIQVEIPAPKAQEKEVVETPLAPKQEEKTVFFDEKDFDDIKSSQVNVEPKRETIREPYSNTTYATPKKEVYGVKKEEDNKRFAPTPIISPVYGVLDRNYKKDDIVDHTKSLPKTNKDITLDDVRNKAYGTLEDELESTLFGKTSIIFANKEADKQDYKDIEDEIKDTTDAIDLLRDDAPKHEKKEEVPKRTTRKKVSIEESIEEVNNEPDIKEEPDKEDNIVNDALNNNYTSDEKLSESDLFNLIDDMYDKGDK